MDSSLGGRYGGRKTLWSSSGDVPTYIKRKLNVVIFLMGISVAAAT
jgi:hypothetical protein